jgi:hypothetical protein
MPESPELIFRNAVRKSLAKLDTRISESLRSLIQHSYPPEVAALAFEVFSDGFTDSFPVRAFFLDRFNTEYFVMMDGVANYPSPIDPGLIDIDGVYSEKIEEKLQRASPNADSWEIATDELIKWFSGHWLNCGGDKFSLRASISAHDSRMKFNLKTSKWRRS